MRNNNRTKNTLRNIVFGFTSKIVSLLLPFAIRTIIIYKLGADYVGLRSLFTSILQVLSVAELGFSSAIIFSIYKPIADNDISEVREWLTLYRRIYHVVGTIILVAGILVLPFLPYLIKGDYPSDINLYTLYLIYLFNTVISYFAFGYKNVVLIANQRRDILSNVELVIAISRSVIQVLVLLIFNNYYLYVIFLPIFTLVSNITIEIISRKKYPELICGGSKPNTEKLRAISNQIKGVAIGKISLVARNAFDSIILSSMCGLAFVTIYSNYYYIFSSVGGMLAVVLTSMAASVGNSLVTESIEKNYQDHNKFDFYFMWICGWFTVCMFCLYQHFMYLWVGEKLMAPFFTMVLFCIYFYSNRMAEIRALYSEAAGLWWKFRYVTIGEMFANLSLNFILGYRYQMNGILIATIITSFISSFILISLVTFKEYFRRSIKEYYMNNVLYIMVTIVVAFITYKSCSLVSNNGIIGLMLKAIICIFVPNIIYLITYLLIPKYREYIIQLKNKSNKLLSRRNS